MKTIPLILLMAGFFFFPLQISAEEPAVTAVTSPDETSWWNETVFYEIFVRSFYDGDGDGIGDLEGLIQKLDYLNDGDPATDSDLGITGIWLMPVCESPSYHGYDVVDYRQIESDYGDNEQFLELMAACQARGIKVIVDYVMNHSSNQHPWFISSALNEPGYRDYYLWRSHDPGYTQPWGGNNPVWHRHLNGEYYYGVFWGGMPDLNYAHPALKQEMFDIASFWLEDMQVDGFRCDAVKYIFEDGPVLENTPSTLSFWEEFHQHYKQVNPAAMAVGEAWDITPVVLDYVEGKFDFCFEFTLAGAILEGVARSSPQPIIDQMAEIYQLYPYNQFGTFLTNHDQNRVFDELGMSVDLNRTAAAVYLTLPGIPFLYYGEEIGMKGKKPDENIRRPMQWNGEKYAGFTTGYPWHGINKNYQEYNVEAGQQDENSLWQWYRKLIGIRTREPALTRGDYQLLPTDNPGIYAFLRQWDKEAVCVLINFLARDVSDLTISATTTLPGGIFQLSDLWQQGEETEISITQDGEINNWQPALVIPARSLRILKFIF